MAVGDWSTDPAQNTAIDGVNIAEGCPAANLNDAIRRVMASVRVRFENVPNASDYVTKAGAVFLTQPVFQGRGALLHHNDSANGSGRVFVQPVGGTAPTMANGDILLEH